MGWKILLPQEIMSEGRKLLEDAGHTVIDGRGFETEDVLADFKEYQPDAMIVRITPITREVIESNPNLKVIVRKGLPRQPCPGSLRTGRKQHLRCRDSYVTHLRVQP